jgi:Tol biopolymer transport system component
MRRFAGILYALLAAALPARAAQPESPVAIPSRAIGYTQHATALPGGRLANVATVRAMLLVPGSRPVMLAADLIDESGSWTQFVGWFPDGKTAIIGRAWESEANARFEEEHKTFRFRAGDWLYDTHLLDLATGRADNVTAVERVSFYNTGVFPWPDNPGRLGFTALIDGISKPFAMDRDGTNKTDLARDSTGFSYGFSGSPDGKRIAYHDNYQVWLAAADGANRFKIDTGHPFNFAPTWSPDGRWLLFVSGEHYDCHPHVVRADGTGLRKIGNRNGYRGVMEFLDVPDFHGGSSDVPVWSHDGREVYFTARVAGRDGVRDTVELFEVGIREGDVPVRLTTSSPGALHYHPRPSPDGMWLLFGSHRESPGGGRVRNLFARRLADGLEVQLTDLTSGQAAMHGHWQPENVPPAPDLSAPPGP